MNTLSSDECRELYFGKAYGAKLREVLQHIYQSGNSKNHLKVNVLESLLVSITTKGMAHSADRIAWNKFYHSNPDLFSGKRVLEIGAGDHFDSLLVRRAKSYHAADRHYGTRFIEKPGTSLKVAAGLRDEREIPVYGPKDSIEQYIVGNHKLIASDYRDLPKSEYDVVINSGFEVEKPGQLRHIPRLMAPNGIYLSMCIPNDLPAHKQASEMYLSNPSETWIEVNSWLRVNEGLLVVSKHQK